MEEKDLYPVAGADGEVFWYNKIRFPIPVRYALPLSHISFDKYNGPTEVLDSRLTYRTNHNKLNDLADIELCSADLLHAREAFLAHERYVLENKQYFAKEVDGDNQAERSGSVAARQFVIARALFESGCVTLVRSFDHSNRKKSPLQLKYLREGMPEELKNHLDFIINYPNWDIGHAGKFTRSSVTKFWVEIETGEIVIQFNSFAVSSFGTRFVDRAFVTLIDWIIENKLAPLYKQKMQETAAYLKSIIRLDSQGYISIPRSHLKLIDNKEEYDRPKINFVYGDFDRPIVQFKGPDLTVYMRETLPAKV